MGGRLLSRPRLALCLGVALEKRRAEGRIAGALSHQPIPQPWKVDLELLHSLGSSVAFDERLAIGRVRKIAECPASLVNGVEIVRFIAQTDPRVATQHRTQQSRAATRGSDDEDRVESGEIGSPAHGWRAHRDTWMSPSWRVPAKFRSSMQRVWSAFSNAGSA